MEPGMLDPRIVRLVVFVVILLAVGALLGFSMYKHFGGTDATASADSQGLAQIQQQLTGIEKRLGALETRRKAELAKAPPDVKAPEPAVPSQVSTPRAPQAQIQVSPAFRHHSQTVAAQPPLPDPASAQRLATLDKESERCKRKPVPIGKRCKRPRTGLRR